MRCVGGEGRGKEGGKREGRWGMREEGWEGGRKGGDCIHLVMVQCRSEQSKMLRPRR